MDGPQGVGVVLHPHPAAPTVSSGISRRTWLRFHSRLPRLAWPDADDPRETVHFRCRSGDGLCVVSEARRQGVEGAYRSVAVITLGPGDTQQIGGRGAAPVVRLREIDCPVRLHAHLTGGAAGRFLDHLDRLEAAGLDVACVDPWFWTHLAAAVEVGVSPRQLPWPDECAVSNQEGRR